MAAPEENVLVQTLLADTERELAAIEKLPEHKRFPRLLLLALEREQVAAVAYSEDMISGRIEALPVDDATRELIRRVVLWVHRDEALHAQYMRGLLLQSRKRASSALPAAVIIAHQVVGGVGGWVSAVSHHHDSESFGLRRAVAGLAIGAGKLMGRIPDGLADELSYRGFRRFCLLNLALEETAVLSYERMIGIVRTDEEASAFQRILEDERRHAEVFQVLAAAFDESDRLRPGLNHEELAAQIAEVSPWFLPGHIRAESSDSQFGLGSSVRVERGESGELERTLARALDLGGLEQIVRANPGPVAVRCQFMLGYHKDDISNIVHPEVMELLATKLLGWGATEVALVETPMAYDRFFANRSVKDVAKYFGFTSPNYHVVDIGEDRREIEFERGLVSSHISGTWADAAVRIVVSKLTGDPAEMAFLSLVSLGGIGERTDQHLYTDRLLDHRTAALMALDVAPPDFAVVDAWHPVADGPLGVMGCHRPSSVRRIYAGADAFSVDAAVLDDMGFPDPFSSIFIKQADQWFGRSSRATRVEGEPGPLEGFRAPQRSLWFKFISAAAAPIYFNLSGRGKLFVPAMDTDAFPPLEPPSRPVRLIRWAAQRLFGLHPPGA